MDIRKLWITARWEFVQKGKTKAFLVSLILTPVLIIAFSVLPSLLMLQETEEPTTIYVIDQTGRYATALQQYLARKYHINDTLARYQLISLPSDPAIQDSIRQVVIHHIQENRAEGLLLIPANFDSTLAAEFWSKKAGDFRLFERISGALEQFYKISILRHYQLPPEVAQKLEREIHLATRQITAEGKVEKKDFFSQFLGAYLGALLLFLLVMTSAQLLVRSILEEKMNRLIEMLLSSTSPLNLMLGKIIGLGGLSIVQAIVWITIAIGIASATQFTMANDLLRSLPIIAIYVVLGYMLYASILIALGSLATTEQEAQNITGYAVLFLILPVVFIAPIMQNPDALLFRILSYFPLFTPTLMTVRWHLTLIPWWELLLTLLLLLLSTIFIGWFGAKIFRIAILSYGKRITLPELFRFFRAAKV